LSVIPFPAKLLNISEIEGKMAPNPYEKYIHFRRGMKIVDLCTFRGLRYVIRPLYD